jgi:hypothetical protein
MKDINKINNNKKNILIIFRICVIFLILSSAIFVFYIIDSKNMAMSLVKYKNNTKKSSNKLMSNPKIRFEYENGNFYDIKGKYANYQKNGNVTIKDVVAYNNNGNITSEQLEINNNGNIIIFTGNPKLEFYSINND